jgi:hypothetical protein
LISNMEPCAGNVCPNIGKLQPWSLWYFIEFIGLFINI